MAAVFAKEREFGPTQSVVRDSGGRAVRALLAVSDGGFGQQSVEARLLIPFTCPREHQRDSGLVSGKSHCILSLGQMNNSTRAVMPLRKLS